MGYPRLLTLKSNVAIVPPTIVSAAGIARVAPSRGRGAVTTDGVPMPIWTGDPSQTLVIYEPFTRYVSVTQMGAASPSPSLSSPYFTFNPSPHETSQAVDSAHVALIAADGGAAIELSYDGGQSFGGQNQESCNLVCIGAPSQPNNKTVNISFRARITPGPGWNPATLAVAIKFLEAFHNVNQNSRHQWNTRYPTNTGAPGLPGQLQYTTTRATVFEVIDQKETQRCGAMPVGPRFEDIADGAFHDFLCSFRPNSSNGARDGHSYMWIDDQLCIRIEASAIGVRPLNGEKEWCTDDDVDNNIANADGIHHINFGGPRTTDCGPFKFAITKVRWWHQ